MLGAALALPVAARAGTIRQVKALNWQGTARVQAGAKALSIDVKTRVEPFVRARSETRLAGTSDMRTLIIEPDGGWVERGGIRTPLPAAQTLHEREQYAIYGFILGVLTAKATGGHLANDPAPGAFMCDAVDGRISAATYTVHAPDGNGKISESIRCSDWRAVSGLAWPYRIDIDQHPDTGSDDASFSLVIDYMTFEFA